MTYLLSRTTAIGAIGALAATSAFGVITAQPNEGTAGEYFETALSVPDGCDGSATVSILVKIPDTVTHVKPQMKPGWRVQFKTRKLLEPRKLEDGQTITETVDEVSWSGGPLPNDHYDTFGLRMKLPDAAGQTLWFPVIQECRKGGRSWVGIPKPGMNQSEYKNSAPFVRIVPKAP